MPFVPAPTSLGTSPLPTPGEQPPTARAVRFGVMAALSILVVALAIGQLFLNNILFLTPGLQAQAGGAVAGQGGATFQGFVFGWTRRDTGGGYQTAASLGNMKSQANLFHMNAVIIKVVADMPARSESDIFWHSTDKNNLDTLPDADYLRAIQDARKAGLVPILELEVRQQDTVLSRGDESPSLVGATWSSLHSNQVVGLENGSTGVIGTLEKTWFDNYTAFAVHFAQISQSLHLPYFIFGDGLTNVSYDTSATSAQADPGGIDRSVPGDVPCPKTASGRRECEWRHVIQALRNSKYALLMNHAQTEQGGGYTGKLIYAASWSGASDGGATKPEFEQISWWDAVSYIGLNAGFPITQNQSDAPVNVLDDGWHGRGTGLAGQGDIFSRLETVAEKYRKQIVFTAAGYSSAPGANSAAFTTGNVSAVEDDFEQLNDMQALLTTFTGTAWWAGVFWTGDEPVAPRTKQPNWNISTNWAGDNLANSKASGKWLATFYQNAPIACSC